MQTCPGCGAPMRLEDGRDSLVCDYCKQVYVPEENEEGVRLLGTSSALECPVCAVPLTEGSMARHRVLYCTHCHGVLVEVGEFGGLVGDLRAAARGTGVTPHAPAENELQRHIRCPKCHQPMDTHYYAGPGNVIIDDCARCELNWLDAGELRTITHAPDHSYTHSSQSISDYGVRFEE